MKNVTRCKITLSNGQRYTLKKFNLLDEAVKELKKALIERDPYPPYREQLHPRKHWQRKPYWLRTRSNPKKKGYH